MPIDFEEEALKAQAIVARTYTLYKLKNNKDKLEEFTNRYLNKMINLNK